MHVDEEQLQRLVDDELDELAEPANDWAQEHMQNCESCRERVATARREQDEVFSLLGSLDHKRPTPGHGSAVARARKLDSRWMRRAAGFVLAAALSGAAYAAPGSPLRPLVASLLRAGADRPSTPASPEVIANEPAASGVTVAPGNRMIITFATTQLSGNVTVTIGDTPEIEVRAESTGAAFDAGEDRLAIDNTRGTSDFSVAIPRDARLVEIRIGGDRIFLKDRNRIEASQVANAPGNYVIPLTLKR